MAITQANLSKVCITNGSEYVSGETYPKLCIVTYNNSSYISKFETNTVPTNTDYWQLLAQSGRGITSITKTGTIGLVDTYTITYTDGTTTTFDITNGEIASKEYTIISNGIWNFGEHNKIILQTTDLSQINNMTNGDTGYIKSTLDITLPNSSLKSADYDYILADNNEFYLYTVSYDGTNYMWFRTVLEEV